MADGDLSALTGLDTLVVIAELDGTVVEANRLMAEANLLDLFEERHREDVHAQLMTSAFSPRPTRMQATDTHHRPGWLEVASHGSSGRAVVVWMPAHGLGPAATPAPTQRVFSPRQTPSLPPRVEREATSLEFAVVSDPELRELAARLRRAIDLAAPSTNLWFVPNVQGHLTRAGPDTRIVVLGNSRYTQFLRKLAGPARYEHAGVCWAIRGRRGAVWYEEPRLDEGVELAAQTEAFDALLHEVSQAVELGMVDRDPHALAHAFLSDLVTSRAERKRRYWPQRMRYALGICRFLIDGFPLLARWDHPGEG